MFYGSMPRILFTFSIIENGHADSNRINGKYRHTYYQLAAESTIAFDK
jgi:hypothetical protein